VLGVDEGGHATTALGLGDDVKRQRCLARGFRTVDLDDPAAGMPPTPRAASSERDPVGMAGTSTFSRLPRRMIEPLPNCLSICARAASIALARSFLSSAIRPLSF